MSAAKPVGDDAILSDKTRSVSALSCGSSEENKNSQMSKRKGEYATAWIPLRKNRGKKKEKDVIVPED